MNTYGDTTTCVPNVEWRTKNLSQSFILDCALMRDDDSFSIVALNLPGCGSQGDTAEEAIGNFVEAARGVLESYRDDDQPVPWKRDYERPRGVEFLRLNVELPRR